jgi:hypothetical protein
VFGGSQDRARLTKGWLRAAASGRVRERLRVTLNDGGPRILLRVWRRYATKGGEHAEVRESHHQMRMPSRPMT